MNFAFATILVILLIAPGILFSKGFFSVPFSKRYLPLNPINELINAIIPSFTLHILYLITVQSWKSYSVDFKLLGWLLFNVNDAEKIQDSFINISQHINLIAAYQFGLWIFAYIFGHIVRLLIRFFDWDKKYRIFRFNNEWHYILTGEITRFPTVQLEPLKYIDYKIVNALVKTDKGAFIYAGILQDYNLAKDGILDTVCLSHVMRRPIDSDRINTDTNITEGNQSRYYKIPGSILVIPYTNILNFNLHYIQAKASDMEDETPLESDEGTNAR